jgi:putative ABC transport system ATP-binding protein
VIRTRGLGYMYPGGAALEFADVDVAQGGVLLLSGASGSGKSTWLALVAGLVRPSRGELVVVGQDLMGLVNTAADAWRARTVGFLPQKLHLSAALTVQQNLAFAQWAAGVPQDLSRIASVLVALDVAELGGRRPAQLSGGQAQRVALARAVLLQPQIILADEPTASLDDAAAADAVSLLLRTALAQAATLVIASHDARVPQHLMQEKTPDIGIHRLQLLSS